MSAYLQEKVSELQMTVRVKEQMLADRAAESANRAAELGEWRQRTAILEEETDTLTQQAEDLTQQVDDLTQQVEALTQQHEDLTQQVETLQEELRRREDSEVRVTHVLDEFRSDPDLAAECDDVLKDMQLFHRDESVRSGCFQTVLRRIDAWKKRHMDDGEHEEDEQAVDLTSAAGRSCRRRQCKVRVWQLQAAAARGRQDCERQVLAKEQQLLALSDALVTTISQTFTMSIYIHT